MIDRYDKFIEGISFFKKECMYYYSDRFHKILLEMNQYRDVGAQILIFAKQNSKILDDITLIDIDDKDDSVTFIQVNRLSRIKESENEGSSNLVGWIFNKWSKSYIDLDFDGWKVQRTSIGIGRFLTRVAEKSKNKISDSEKEEFVNLYKSRFKILKNSDDYFEMCQGDDIKKWYLESNYSINKGQLSSSCMRYERCQDYFDIYTMNPDVCRLLILYGEDRSKIIGRSIIWKLNSTDEKYYMDRIYTNLDSDIKVFENYANKNGWMLYNNIMSKGEKIEVKVNNIDYIKYPYMDTLYLYNPSIGILSNDIAICKTTNKEGWYRIQSVEGKYESMSELKWSNYHDRYISIEDSVWCVDIDDWVGFNHAIYLEYKDEYVSDDCDVTYSDYDNLYYYDDDVVYSDCFRFFIYRPLAVKVFVNDSDHIDFIPVSEMDKYSRVITTLTKEGDGEEKRYLIKH